MQTLGVRHVPCWKVVVELNVRGETHPREGTLEEVVTEKGVLRNLSFHDGLKGLDVVNSLTDVGPLSEKVLIHIRYHVGIRIESRLPREELREPAARR